MKEILEKYLEACYNTHNVKISDKYPRYILKAMEEFGKEAFNAGRQSKYISPISKAIQEWVLFKYESFEDYLKSLDNEKKEH